MTTPEDRAEHNRKHPIYGTDFSKPLSMLVNDVRDDLTRARGRLGDLIRGYPNWKERLDHVEGLLTCGIVALHASNQEIIKFEIERDDREFGKSLVFRPRGIGTDICPGCFVCGDTPSTTGYLSNIAAFVESKEEGEEIVSWFTHGARLDYRDHEPAWIQVKIGACAAHLPNLEWLANATSWHGRIRKKHIEDAVQPLTAGVEDVTGKAIEPDRDATRVGRLDGHGFAGA